MIFSKRLRDGVRRGEITCSVRIWTRPHVRVGGRYRMEEGEIEVASILPMSLADITPELARESGFKGVVDLLKIANTGKARTSIWSGSTTCLQAEGPQFGAGANASELRGLVLGKQRRF